MNLNEDEYLDTHLPLLCCYKRISNTPEWFTQTMIRDKGQYHISTQLTI